MLPQKSDEWRNNVSIWETADLPLPLPDNKLWLMLGRGGVGTQLFRLSQNDKPSLVDTPIARFLRFVRAPVATALFFYVYDNVGFEIFQKSKRIENCLVFLERINYSTLILSRSREFKGKTVNRSELQICPCYYSGFSPTCTCYCGVTRVRKVLWPFSSPNLVYKLQD